jgi:hypothetical protein
MRRSHITAAMPTINRPVNRIRTTDIPVILCAFSLDKVKLFFLYTVDCFSYFLSLSVNARVVPSLKRLFCHVV